MPAASSSARWSSAVLSGLGSARSTLSTWPADAKKPGNCFSGRMFFSFFTAIGSKLAGASYS